MDSKSVTVKNIIKSLPSEFTSHEFIQRFTHKYESNYVEWLSHYQKGAYQVVHGQIAKYLSKNLRQLGIKKLDKVNSKNIFGTVSTGIQGWKKIVIK